MVELIVFHKCSLLSLGFEGLLHFAPRPETGVCLPWPSSSVSNVEWLLPDVVYWSTRSLWHTQDGTTYSGHIFFHRVTQEVSHCSALHTWCDHPLSLLCVSEAKVGVLKPQRNTWSAAGMCRARAAGMSEKLGSLKLFPGRSHFHVCLLLIRPNLCLVARIPEMACTLKGRTGIHHTGSQAKQLLIPLWPSFLILAGLLALLL